ncbi:MAG: hypothetical protein FWF67_01180 [Fibromonadales bacterium]|nr:hypothetical protein [Fibromonadales bacterium]
MKEKIAGLSKNYPKAEIYFDPLFYASVPAQQYGNKARIGKLLSDYSYFSPKQYRDLRRERFIKEEIEKCLDFQKSINLKNFILPNIVIQDGLSSESSNIAKNFLDIGNEIANEQKIQEKCLLTLAFGQSCFRNQETLIDFVDEITGFNSNVKGFYLLAETTIASGSNHWFSSDVLNFQMYLTYALKQANYNIIHGFSLMPAPFLFAAGCDSVAFGWYNSLRYFSLDRFVPREEKAMKKPNRRYLDINLWHRIESSKAASYKLLSENSAYINTDSTDTEEILQHWKIVGDICGKVEKFKLYPEKLSYLLDWLKKSEIYRTKLENFSIHNFNSQVKNCRLAIYDFADLAEIPLPPQNG